MFRYRNILVPLDGSTLAERALLPAVHIAKAMSAPLLLLRVISPPPINDALELNVLLMKEREAEAIAYLGDVKAKVTPLISEVKTAVIHGAPAKSIIHYAQDNNIDLIVLSSHGHSGLKRWVFGSVATRLLRKAPCSTLVIRAKVTIEPFSQNHFLIPLDGSELAEHALKPAMSFAMLTQANITLFTAVFALDELAPALYKHRLNLVEREERIIKKRYLRKLVAAFADVKISAKAIIDRGAAHECILAYAHKHLVDLIIMSSHGRSGVELWAFGSVTEKVLNGSHCAVLIVREKNHRNMRES